MGKDRETGNTKRISKRKKKEQKEKGRTTKEWQLLHPVFWSELVHKIGDDEVKK